MSDNPYDRNGIPKLYKNNNKLQACEIIGTVISISLLWIVKFSKIIFNKINKRAQK